jgi:hypothetical protein
VQNHKITKIKNGALIMSLLIYHNNMLLLNTYAPAKGKKKNDEWMMLTNALPIPDTGKNVQILLLPKPGSPADPVIYWPFSFCRCHTNSSPAYSPTGQCL